MRVSGKEVLHAMYIKGINQETGVNISRWWSVWLVESIAGAFKVSFKPHITCMQRFQMGCQEEHLPSFIFFLVFLLGQHPPSLSLHSVVDMVVKQEMRPILTVVFSLRSTKT